MEEWIGGLTYEENKLSPCCHQRFRRKTNNSVGVPAAPCPWAPRLAPRRIKYRRQDAFVDTYIYVLADAEGSKRGDPTTGVGASVKLQRKQQGDGEL